MRVEFTLPLPDAEAHPKQDYYEFLDTALTFMAERPVFTAKELHEHLLARFTLSDRPADFWRCFASIREAVLVVCEMRDMPVEWHEQPDDGYYDRLHSLDIAGLPRLESSGSEELAERVRAELAALFHGREEVGEAEMLFYMHAHQGFGDEAAAILQLLVDDGFLDRTESGAYQFVPEPEPEPEPEAESESVPLTPPRLSVVRRQPPRDYEAVEIDGIMFARSPSQKAVPAIPLPRPVRQSIAEASPPVPDEPFDLHDLSRAIVLLRRLTWQNARHDGVSVSTLVASIEDGRASLRERRAIIARLWRRGYLLRSFMDGTEEAVVRLSPHILDGHEEWPRAIKKIMHELSQPHEPPTQQKTGS